MKSLETIIDVAVWVIIGSRTVQYYAEHKLYFMAVVATFFEQSAIFNGRVNPEIVCWCILSIIQSYSKARTNYTSNTGHILLACQFLSNLIGLLQKVTNFSIARLALAFKDTSPAQNS